MPDYRGSTARMNIQQGTCLPKADVAAPGRLYINAIDLAIGLYRRRDVSPRHATAARGWICDWNIRRLHSGPISNQPTLPVTRRDAASTLTARTARWARRPYRRRGVSPRHTEAELLTNLRISPRQQQAAQPVMNAVAVAVAVNLGVGNSLLDIGHSPLSLPSPLSLDIAEHACADQDVGQ
jgi:hypothetical protein